MKIKPCPTCEGTGYTAVFGALGQVCNYCNGMGVVNDEPIGVRSRTRKKRSGDPKKGESI